MPEAQPQQIPTIVWLLQPGGIAPLALGLILALVGMVFVIRPNRSSSMILAFLSLLPAIIGLIVVYAAAAEYAEMARSRIGPKPAEFARLTGRAMGSSFCGLLGTILSVFVAILALARTGKSVDNPNSETRS